MRQASRRKFHVIYKTTHIESGRYYLGMHSTDDLNDGYVGSGKALWVSLQKFGRGAHRYEILEQLASRSELARREEELVNETALRDPLCMNLQKGGYPNREMTEKLRRFISERTREGITPEAREKMRVAKLGKTPWNLGKTYKNPKQSAVMSGRKNGPLSEERKRKISESLKGRTYSAERVRKSTEARMKKWAERNA